MLKQRLKELREERGLSKRELSRIIGLNHRAVSQYELGKTEPNYQTLKKLCDYFGITADYLLGFSDV